MVFVFSDDSIDDITDGHSGEDEAMHDEEEEEVLGDGYQGDDDLQGDGDHEEPGGDTALDLDDDDDDDREQITVEINGEEFVVNKMEESLL